MWQRGIEGQVYARPGYECGVVNSKKIARKLGSVCTVIFINDFYCVKTWGRQTTQQTRCLSPLKSAISLAPCSIPIFISKWSRFSVTSSCRQWDVFTIAGFVIAIPPPACLLYYLLRTPRQNYLRAAIILHQAAKRLSVPTYTCYICYWYNVWI
jgi:hypothetical protein